MSLYFSEPFFSLDDFQRFFSDAFDPSSAPSERQLTRRAERNGEAPPTTTAARRSLALARGFQPRMDIHESPESNLLTATLELPGLTRENVHIDVQPGRLTVSGEQTLSDEYDEDGYIHRERRTGRFERSLPLPNGIKASDIKASLENGLLSITFPKSSPEQAPQKITIS